MRAGSLKDRIVIQHKVDARDNFGQPIATWAEIKKVWADFRFLNGTETIKAGVEAAELKASVRIRKTEITNQMRVLFKGVVYEITAVLPAQAHIDLTVIKAK